MNIIHQLLSKPWLSDDADISESYNQTQCLKVTQTESTKTALVFFLMVVTVVFLLISITFLSRSQYPDFTALAGPPWLPFSNPITLWVNSAFLLLASISIRFAATTKPINESVGHTRMVLALCLTGLFSCLFLIGQLLVWQQLAASGFAVNGNPANSYFYLFTGIHGLHLAGGFIALIRVVITFVKHTDSERLTANLGLCVWYWHYLFIVWMLLFALLTATPDTYKTIALLCGF
ncbi:Cytochrome c oxidase subunit III [Moritella viscosa]|uniref:cytochrome c oxidase subunit 3 n=1 Tax=Moritella viscosa TaxID=80854 RepID=UPI000911124D|nr:cytochrome c oxidase subunit 3 [Moritella viscosa]SGZ03667.1 Cytochrome c oxidase subunit III [Moritella viscosa]